jgi:hypothetical protein
MRSPAKREVWRAAALQDYFFWPVSATFVAETGQKRGFLGEASPPRIFLFLMRRGRVPTPQQKTKVINLIWYKS